MIDSSKIEMDRLIRKPNAAGPIVIFCLLLLLSACNDHGTNHAEDGSPVDRVAATTVEMEAMGAAMTAWLIDQLGGSALPPTAPLCAWEGTFDTSDLSVVSRRKVASFLVPEYIERLPSRDAWGHRYEFRIDPELREANILSIRSKGADGEFDADTYVGGYTSEPEDDIVWSSLTFVRRPAPSDPRSRQRATVEQERVVGRAMLLWASDQIGARNPAADRRPPEGTRVDLSEYTKISHSDLVNNLAPSSTFFYTRCIPELDGWGNPYQYYRNESLFGPKVLAIRSAGADGVVEGDVYEAGVFPASESERDIVWVDGFFVRHPEETEAPSPSENAF